MYKYRVITLQYFYSDQLAILFVSAANILIHVHIRNSFCVLRSCNHTARVYFCIYSGQNAAVIQLNICAIIFIWSKTRTCKNRADSRLFGCSYRYRMIQGNTNTLRIFHHTFIQIWLLNQKSDL